jgi:E3 ubiquitin-protein ligase mind-bomb
MGKVIDVRGWDNESRRSVANVMWASGSTNVYRIGHKGKVDLKYAVDSPGPFYYRDHLPVLGQQVEGTNRSAIARSISTASESQRNSVTALFNVGDKVKVIIEDVNELKSLQEGHGGWNQRMAEFIGHIGTVHRVTDRADIRVQFEGCHNRWTFNPNALSKVISYSVGDIVKISDDINKVKELQKSHGEWNDHMLGSIGKMGKIVKVYEDHDLRVTVDGQTWTFNPQCVSLMPGSATEMNNTMISHPSREETNSRLGSLLEQEPIQASTSAQREPPDVSSVASASVTPVNKENLAREAAQGRIEIVKEIIKRYPECVDSRSSGKTALQVAAHQGHIDIVSFLLDSNADINIRDDEVLKLFITFIN